MSRDPWKLVTSVDELRAGMCVELRPNAVSGKRARVILTGIRPSVTYCTSCGGGRNGEPRRFDWDDASGAWICTADAIPERRLYALIDDDTAADETTVSRRREMVEQ